jgi:hypothetical protein
LFEAQLRLYREQVDVVIDDIQRTTRLRPVIEVRLVNGNAVAVSYNFTFTAPSAFSLDPAEALTELADYLQEFVISDLGRVWPMCSEHSFGLEPVVRDERAVWWCSRDHVIDPVGQLRSS